MRFMSLMSLAMRRLRTRLRGGTRWMRLGDGGTRLTPRMDRRDRMRGAARRVGRHDAAAAHHARSGRGGHGRATMIDRGQLRPIGRRRLLMLGLQ